MRQALTKLSGMGMAATLDMPMQAFTSTAPASSVAGKLVKSHGHSTAAKASVKTKAPTPSVKLSETRAFVGAEHRVRTGDLRPGNESGGCSRFSIILHEAPRSFDFLRSPGLRPPARLHESSRGFSRFMCPACAKPPPAES
jgi:hypothetical protein